MILGFVRWQIMYMWTVMPGFLGALSVLLIVSCQAGGDGSVSREPRSEFETQGISGLVEAYATALQQEDIDRLQALLEPVAPPMQQGIYVPPGSGGKLGAGEFADTQTFREAISSLFQNLSVTDLRIPKDTVRVEDNPLRVSFQEIESIEDPAALKQQTRLYHTTFQLAREEVDGVITFRIQAVKRDGPLVDIAMTGQVKAGALTRIEVREMATFPIEAGDIAVLDGVMHAAERIDPFDTAAREACQRQLESTKQRLILAVNGRFQGLFTSSLSPGLQRLCVRVRRAGVQADDADVVLVHRYRHHIPGTGVVQNIAENDSQPFFAVALAPDSTVWFGSEAAIPGSIGTVLKVNPENLDVDRIVPVVPFPYDIETIGRFKALAFDTLGRLHLPFILETQNRRELVGSGDVVMALDHQDIFCQTVNIWDDRYPFREIDSQAGLDRPSTSTRIITAEAGDVWLFGSSGGAARVSDTFRAGQCASDLKVQYAAPLRRGKEQDNNGLLSNIVTAMVAGANETLYFGTIVGLSRLQDGTFTSLRFDPSTPLSRDIATMEELIEALAAREARNPAELSEEQVSLLEEAFFDRLEQAIFNAQPLADTGIGDLTFEEIFDGSLVKEDLIFSAVEDRQDRLWVGTLGGGVRRIEGDAQTLHLTRQNGLGSNIILALAAHEDTIWAATDEGISRIRDERGTITIANFSPLDGLAAPVRDVAVDANGTAWLATDGGMFRIIPQGLQADGVVLQTSDEMAPPVVGADVAILNSPFRAVTNTEGLFAFTDLPPGQHYIRVSGDLAGGGPFTAAFSGLGFPEADCTLEPIVVVRRETAMTVDPAQGGTLDFPSGARVVLEPGGVEFPGAPEMSLTRLPLEAPPFPLTCNPSLRDVGALAELQPEGLKLVRPMMLTLPNEGRLAAGRKDVLSWCLVNDEGEPRYLVNTGSAGQVEVGAGEITVASTQLRENCAAVMFAPFAPASSLSWAEVADVVKASYQGAGGMSLPRRFGPSTSPQGIEVRVAPPAEAVVGSTHPMILQLTDAMGQALAVSGEPVTFQLLAPRSRPGTLPPALCPDPAPPDPSACPDQLLSDEAGQIRALLTLGQTAGTLQILATAGEAGAVTPVVIEVEGLPDREQGRVVEVSGNNQVVEPGEEAGDPLEVRLEDPFGNPLVGELVAAEIIEGEGQLRTEAMLPGDGSMAVTARSDSQGIARFFLRAGENPGEIVVRITALGQEAQFLAIVGLSLPFGIAVEASGDLAVIDASLNAVLRIDPNRGIRTVVSYTGGRTESFVGTGPPFENPKDIAIASDGSFWIVDAGGVELPRVMRVDPVTGDRTIVSDANMGEGPLLQDPVSLASEADGRLVVLDRGASPRVLRLDPMTGDRSIVSDTASSNGLLFSDPISIAVEANGQLVVAETGLFDEHPRLMRVDPVTGNREVVSDDNTGSGTPFQALISIAVEANGDLVALESGVGLAAVVRVNPMTGDRAIVSGCRARNSLECVGAPVGGGPLLRFPVDLAIEDTGDFVVVDVGPGAVIRVGRDTGDRTIVSQSAGIGSGPSLINPIGVAVEQSGTLAVVEGFLGLKGVLRVAPDSGNRTIVSDDTVGLGSPFHNPLVSAVEADGQLVVVEAERSRLPSRVLRVDAVSGDRTPVSDNNMGGGPRFGDFLSGIVVAPDGALIVLEASPPRIVRVDPVNGDRVVVSDANTGIGPRLENPFSMALETDGNLVVADGFNPDPRFGGRRAVMRVNLVNGNRMIVSDALTGTGPLLLVPTGIAIASDGQIIVADGGLRAVLRVDPVSGDRIVVSGGLRSVVGNGPPFFDPITVAVEASGSLAVVESFVGLKALMRVDPDTGNRTILSK